MTADDLDPSAVAAALGQRPVRAYPALLSTEPEAMAWARGGAPSGAVVVADYQASPRGRAGFPWSVQAGVGLGFTLLVRPGPVAEREGWLYVAASVGLGEALAAAAVEWPDVVVGRDGAAVARVGVYAEPGAGSDIAWATLTILVEHATPPRAPLLARLATAVEAVLAEPTEEVLPRYRRLCRTLGRTTRARLIPLGPGGPEVTGEAVDVLGDGALVLRTALDNRVAVLPQSLGILDEPTPSPQVPDEIYGRRIE